MTSTHTGGVEEHLEQYVHAFNSGEFDVVRRFYTEEAVSAWDPEKPLTGAEREESLAGFLALGPRMTARIRESHVTRDTALLTVEWSIDIDSDGTRERLAGIATDVLSADAEGGWRYAVDAPYGDPRNKTE
ncbi:hypothetical protein GCM10010387_32720 [Streptomyces inusitatus]|uniref:SnoaL-like domain-containing protein n=1 Tax=Streptomyces inusitatus TaxID=68221 RepID=A0A918Q6Z7_9ACTN|nr:nuclear transport factor 2 family protein [Streptomyces inusitatus]GGZ35967.1 hypothetical protein GCM10010387_32720 [Streptomyces inusitatus]